METESVMGKSERMAVIILAAGKGTRMRSQKAKVLHEVAGEPMISYPVRLAREIGAEKVVVVVGHQAEEVKAALQGESVEIAVQDVQLGTAHAVLSAKDNLSSFDGDVLILPGDVPLIRKETIMELVGTHKLRNSEITLLVSESSSPTGYGRLVKDEMGFPHKIVEELDATDEEKKIAVINTGIYLAKNSCLLDVVARTGNKNVKGEFYLTDLVEIATNEGRRLSAHLSPDIKSLQGINDQADLAQAEQAMRARILEALMESGVRIIDPGCTYIGRMVKAAQDTIIHPLACIQGCTEIGANCVIEQGVAIKDSILGEGVRIKAFSVIEGARIESGVTVGPMARLRPGTVLQKGARIGNFVEVKNSDIGEDTKANHLTYIGDATIGRNVNVGCGTITCNYDGEKKYRSIVGDGAFIGSDTQLVAPVTVGAGAYIGSGSTITKDVPAEALAVARSRQVNIEGWARSKLNGGKGERKGKGEGKGKREERVKIREKKFRGKKKKR